MPISAEAIMLMLATVRIGAIHPWSSPVRCERARRPHRRERVAAGVHGRRHAPQGHYALTPIVNEALTVGGVRRARDRGAGAGDRSVRLEPDGNAREISWDDFLARGEGQSSDVEKMEANEPAWILATSGTTAKPKLAVHTHGGYQVHVVSMGRWCFGMTPADVWWATSDIGWIVGHSYMVYAPLLIGCTSVVFEGALDHPRPEGNWRTAVEEFGATGIFTSPTAVRMLMRYGDEPLLRVDHSRLERVVCAGEVLNAPAWDWLQNRILKNRAPVIDHMWQTETGGPAFGNPYGIDLLPIRPGSAAIPLPGIDAAVMTLEAVRAEREGDHDDPPSVPGADAGVMGRARAVRARLLAEDSRRLLLRRLRARGRGRLRVVRRPRG
jgi:acetyl-CoA synthetase